MRKILEQSIQCIWSYRAQTIYTAGNFIIPPILQVWEIKYLVYLYKKRCFVLFIYNGFLSGNILVRNVRDMQ